VLLELSLDVHLEPLIELVLNTLAIKWCAPKEEAFARLRDFLIERLRYYLETARKFRYDTVRAVLAAGWDPPLEALRRAEALEAIRDSQDFEALSIAAKRIKNILSKSAKADDWSPGEVDPAALAEAPEKELHRAYQSVTAQIGELKPGGVRPSGHVDYR